MRMLIRTAPIAASKAFLPVLTVSPLNGVTLAAETALIASGEFSVIIGLDGTLRSALAPGVAPEVRGSVLGAPSTSTRTSSCTDVARSLTA